MPYPTGSSSSGRQGQRQSSAAPAPAAPVASFEILDPAVGVDPGTAIENPSTFTQGKTLSLRFTGTGPVTTFAWDPGDGGSISTNGPVVSYTYNTPGTHSPSLTVTNATDSDSATLSNALVIEALPAAPTALFSTETDNGARVVTVTNLSTGSPTSMRLDWGDGTPVQSVDPEFTTLDHIYKSVGTFTITLTATNAGGTTAATRQVTFTQTTPTGGTLEMNALAMNGNTTGYNTTVDIAVPFAESQNVLDIEQYQVTDANDISLPTQWKVTSRWHGLRTDTTTPIKIAIASVAVTLPSGQGDKTGSTGTASLKIVKLAPTDSRTRGAITITDTGGGWVVTNGVVSAAILKFSFKPFNRLTVSGNSVIPANAPGGLRIKYRDFQGQVGSLTEFTTGSNITSSIVEQDSSGGSTKVRIRMKGDVGSTNSLRFEAWWTFRQGTNDVEFEFFLMNERARVIKNDSANVEGFSWTTRRAIEYAYVDFGVATVSNVRNASGTDFPIAESDVYQNLQYFRSAQGAFASSTPWGSDYGTELDSEGAPDDSRRTMRHLFKYKEGMAGDTTLYEATVDPARGNGSGKLLPPWATYDGVWDVQTSDGFLAVGYEFYWQKAPSRVDVSEDTISVALFPDDFTAESNMTDRGFEDHGRYSSPAMTPDSESFIPANTNPITGVPYVSGNRMPADFPSPGYTSRSGVPFPTTPDGFPTEVSGVIGIANKASVVAGKYYVANAADLDGIGNAIGDILLIATNGTFAGATILTVDKVVQDDQYITDLQEISSGNGAVLIYDSSLAPSQPWVSQSSGYSMGPWRWDRVGRLRTVGDSGWRFRGSPRWPVPDDLQGNYALEGGRKIGMRLMLRPRSSSSALMTATQLSDFADRVETLPAAAADPDKVRERGMYAPLPFHERVSAGQDYDLDRYERWLDLMVDDFAADPVTNSSNTFYFGFPTHLEMGARPSSFAVRNFGWDVFGDIWGGEGWMNNSYDTTLRFAEGFSRTRDLRYFNQGRFRAEWTINMGIQKEDVKGSLSDGYAAGAHVYEKGDPSGNFQFGDSGHWWVEGAVAWCRLTGNEQYIQDAKYAVDWVMNRYDNRSMSEWSGLSGNRTWGWNMIGAVALYTFYGPIRHQGPDEAHVVNGANVYPKQWRAYNDPNTETLLDEIRGGLDRWEALESGTALSRNYGLDLSPFNAIPASRYIGAADLGDQNPEIDDVTFTAVSGTAPIYFYRPTELTASDITITNNDPAADTIVSAGENFETAGFAVNNYIKIVGGTNDGVTARIASISGGTITVRAGDALTTEAPGSDITILEVGALTGADGTEHIGTIPIRDYSNNGFIMQPGYTPPCVIQIWMHIIGWVGMYYAVTSLPEYAGSAAATTDPRLVSAIENLAKGRDVVRYTLRYLNHYPLQSGDQDVTLPRYGYFWSTADVQRTSAWTYDPYLNIIASSTHMCTVAVFSLSHIFFDGTAYDRSARDDSDLVLAQMFFRRGVRYNQQLTAPTNGVRRTMAPASDAAAYNQMTGEPAPGVAPYSQATPPNGEFSPITLFWSSSGFEIINKAINRGFYRWGLIHQTLLRAEGLIT